MSPKRLLTAPPILSHSSQEIPETTFRPVALLAWIIAGVSILLAVFSLLLHNLNNAKPVTNVASQPSDVLIAVLFPLVGALIASRKSDNAIGWILCVMGLSEGIAIFSDQYETYALLIRPHVMPLGPETSWMDGWIWIIGYGLIPLLLLLFPTGHFLARRWRWLAWFSAGTVFLAAFSTALPTWSFRGTHLLAAYSGSASSVGITGLDGIVNTASLIAFTISVPLAAICLIVRLRRSRGVERQQLKWFTYAAALVALDLLVNGVYESYLTFSHTALLTELEHIVQALVTATLPLAIGIAILRYRLYDIDVLIKRTLVYSLLTGILALLYFSSVIGLQYLFHGLTGQDSQFAVVASTLIIAILFQPLRHRIQKTIDHRFYRRQYNAEQTLKAFSMSLREEVDVLQLSEQLLSTVEETMQPAHVSLWLLEVSSSNQSAN